MLTDCVYKGEGGNYWRGNGLKYWKNLVHEKNAPSAVGSFFATDFSNGCKICHFVVSIRGKSGKQNVSGRGNNLT